jgi:hypothetical protein
MRIVTYQRRVRKARAEMSLASDIAARRLSDSTEQPFRFFARAF